MQANNWRVLLIGGHSGAGKTTLAQALGRQLGVSTLMVDDIRIALQQITTAVQQPDLHIFLNYQPEQWLKPESIVEDWKRVGKALIKPLKEIMAHHIAVEESGKIIIEGDGLLPALATTTIYNDRDLVPKVRVVFLIEPDEPTLLHNLRHRDRGLSRSDLEMHRAFAHASWLFGQWLNREAKAHQIPVLEPQPRETLLARMFELIS